jgi:hypothetical protein
MIITFYFGAGASHGALPLVKEMPESLKLLRSDLQNKYELTLPGASRTLGNSFQQRLYPLFDDLGWLSDAALRHASIDTFAKKLYVTDSSADLLKLKAVLTCFFLIKQATGEPDKRYDSFFASITSRNASGPVLPENMRILSWNYDLQFEIAFMGYCPESQIAHRLQSDPQPSEFHPERFSIVRLNGIAGLHRNEDNTMGRLFGLIPKREEYNNIIGNYLNYATNQEQYLPLLNFSWEENLFTKRNFPNAMAATIETECLVVVGYSFPFFNRDLDRKLINNMHGLRYVFIQADSKDHIMIEDRFRAINPSLSGIALISDLDQFYLPRFL